MSEHDNDAVTNADDAATTSELDSLKARADMMGISYHPSIGLEKLRAKVNEAIAADGAPKVAAEVDEPKNTNASTKGETPGQKRLRVKNEATALVRIRLQCMNPAKKEWHGEVFTVGNSLIGTVSKFVPFEAEDGYHVPNIIYKMIKDRQCQIFVTKKSKNGVAVREGKLIKEFAVEVLPPLTPEELHDLAQRQALAQSVG